MARRTGGREVCGSCGPHGGNEKRSTLEDGRYVRVSRVHTYELSINIRSSIAICISFIIRCWMAAMEFSPLMRNDGAAALTTP